MHSVAIRLVRHSLLALSALAITASSARGQSECYVADLNENHRKPVSQVIVRADTAFVALGRCLDIVNVADPSAPVQISRTLLPDIIRDIALDDNRAYLAAHRQGVRVLDISTPSAPNELGKLHASPGGFALTVERVAAATENRLFIGMDNTNWVYRVNASDPTALAVDDSLITGSSQPLDIETSGDIAYIADADSVYLFASMGASPLQRTSVFASSAPHDMVVVDSLLFISDLSRPERGGGRLRIVDISKPDAPRALGSVYTAFGYELGVDSGVAVIGGANGAVEAFSVASLSTPQRTSVLTPYLPPITNPSSVTVSGTTALIGHVSEGLFLFDLSSPSEPSLVGRYGDVGTSSSVSTPRGDDAMSLSVYPNPAREGSTIDVVLQQPDHVTVGIYDLLGRQLHLLHDAPLPAGVHTFQHRVEALPAGTYFVRADASEASISTTFVRVR